MTSIANGTVEKVWKSLMRRQTGEERASDLSRRMTKEGNGSLELHRNKRLAADAPHAINWMDIDVEEGRYLLCASSNGCIYMYDLEMATDIDGAGMNDHRAMCSTVPGATGWNATITLGSISAGHTASVLCVQYFPIDRGIFITGSLDKTVKMWDTSNMEVASEYRLQGAVNAIDMSRAGARHFLIAAGSSLGQVNLCCIESGTSICTLNEHKNAIGAVRWYPDNEWMLATGSCDGEIKIWDIRKPLSLLTFSNNANSASVDHFMRPMTAPAGSNAGMNSQYNPCDRSQKKGRGNCRKKVLEGFQSFGPRSPIVSLDFSKDGRYLLTGGKDGNLSAWDSRHSMESLILHPPGKPHLANQVQLAITEDNSFIYMPSGNSIVSFDLHSGTRNSTLKGHQGPVKCCLWRPYCQEMISASIDKQAIIWSSPMQQRMKADSFDSNLDDRDNWSD